MIQVDERIRLNYDKLLKQQKIPEYTYNFYRKWLRYYLDFCPKYQFHKNDRESLTAFMHKLDEKKQIVRQQKQAAHAVNIYYDLTNTDSSQIENAKEKKAKLDSNAKTTIPTTAHNSWAEAYTCLKKEIQVRHYSKRTLEIEQLKTIAVNKAIKK